MADENLGVDEESKVTEGTVDLQEKVSEIVERIKAVFPARQAYEAALEEKLRLQQAAGEIRAPNGHLFRLEAGADGVFVKRWPSSKQAESMPVGSVIYAARINSEDYYTQSTVAHPPADMTHNPWYQVLSEDFDLKLAPRNSYRRQREAELKMPWDDEPSSEELFADALKSLGDEVANITPAQQQAVIKAWVNSHRDTFDLVNSWQHPGEVHLRGCARTTYQMAGCDPDCAKITPYIELDKESIAGLPVSGHEFGRTSLEAY
ncbi:hypothetical protein HY346_02840 [Candidatus Microgenomates bacterium]|nr:hypothetical protein [Candidatus Microgenomates bacterium]